MDKYALLNMITWSIYTTVRDKIENEFDKDSTGHSKCENRQWKAIRFDFRHKNGGAISLLFHAANPNWMYIGVYSIDQAVSRKSGVFPEPGSIEWRFRSDHDCATMDAISNFLNEYHEVIEGWDWIRPWKVIPVNQEQLNNMRTMRKKAHEA